MSNFDEKIKLGYTLVNLKEKKEYLATVKEKNPCGIFFNAEFLNELYPLVFPDKEAWGAITASCTDILDVYIGAIDRKFEELKAEFEKL